MAYLHRSRGAICWKSNSLSYESWLILSLEPYLLKFHCIFKVKEFFLETCPCDDFIGGKVTIYRCKSSSGLSFKNCPARLYLPPTRDQGPSWHSFQGHQGTQTSPPCMLRCNALGGFYAMCKRTQQWWPTTPNTVGCYILRLVACCWELLRKVWNRSNFKLP